MALEYMNSFKKKKMIEHFSDPDKIATIIKALDNAGAINVGTAQGIPVSKEAADAIIAKLLQRQAEEENMSDDIVTRLREYNKGYEPKALVLHEVVEAADEIERLQEQVRYLRHHIKSLDDAITHEGPNPKHHHAVMRKHRQEWPVLWKAIDLLRPAGKYGYQKEVRDE